MVLLAAVAYNGGDDDRTEFGYADVAGDLRMNLLAHIVKGTTASTHAYEYDLLGRITSWARTGPDGLGGVDSVTESFRYDAADRLVEAVRRRGGVLESVSGWRFDRAGNREMGQRFESGAGTVARMSGVANALNLLTSVVPGGESLLVSGGLSEPGRSRLRGIAAYDYELYGEPRVVGLDAPLDTVRQEFLFTGHYYHEATGLYLAPYRAYDPRDGRWLSRDPIAEDGGLNLYGYVGGDPINGFDSLGLSDEKPSLFDRLFGSGGSSYTQGADGTYHPHMDGGLLVTSNDERFGKICTVREYTNAAYNTIESSIIVFIVPSGATGARLVIQAGAQRVVIRTVSRHSKEHRDLVDKARKDYPKYAGKKDQMHQVDPKYLGGDRRGLTVKMDAAYHCAMHQAMRRRIQDYGKGPMKDHLRLKALKKFYEDFPLPID